MRLVALALALALALATHVSAFVSDEDLRVNECNRAVTNERPLADCPEVEQKDRLLDEQYIDEAYACNGKGHLVPDEPCIVKDNPCDIKENFDRMPSECTGLGTVQESHTYTFVLNDSLAVLDHEKRFSFPNKLFEAFATAWGNHWSLRLRPDDLWTMVGVLVKRILDSNHEKLRKNFVDHQGKKELIFITDGYENHPRKHEIGIDQLYWDIHANTKSELALLMLNNFTTSDFASVAVSQLLTMASFRHYFKFSFEPMCGIRAVILDGTHEEWASLPARLDRVIAAVTGAYEIHVDSLRNFRRVLEVMEQTSATRLTDDQAQHKEVRDVWSNVLDNVLMDIRISGGYGVSSHIVQRKGLRGWAAALDGRKPGTQIQIDDSGLLASEGQVYVKGPGTFTAGLLSYSKEGGLVKPEIAWTLTDEKTPLQLDEEYYEEVERQRRQMEAEGWEYREPVDDRAAILELEKTYHVEYTVASLGHRRMMRVKRKESHM